MLCPDATLSGNSQNIQLTYTQGKGLFLYGGRGQTLSLTIPIFFPQVFYYSLIQYKCCFVTLYYYICE